MALGGSVGLLVLGALLLGGPAALPHLVARWQPGGMPAYREVTPRGASAVLGRDLVMDPADATPLEIERLVAAVAAEDPSPLLRLNVFTSEAAAQQRRALIAAGRYAMDETQPDPPEWAPVFLAWVGIYTRDAAQGVHQLSLCLNDTDRTRCSVRRYE